MQTLQENNWLSGLKRTGCDITTAVAFAFYMATFWAALTAQPGIIFNPTWLAAQALLGARFIPPIMVYGSRLRAKRISRREAAPQNEAGST